MGLVFSISNFFINKSSQGRKSVRGLAAAIYLYHINFSPIRWCFSPDLTKVQKVQGQSQQKYVVCINTISITTTYKIGKVIDHQRFRSSIILE